jgi:hypothetical protein
MKNILLLNETHRAAVIIHHLPSKKVGLGWQQVVACLPKENLNWVGNLKGPKDSPNLPLSDRIWAFTAVTLLELLSKVVSTMHREHTIRGPLPNQVIWWKSGAERDVNNELSFIFSENRVNESHIPAPKIPVNKIRNQRISSNLIRRRLYQKRGWSWNPAIIPHMDTITVPNSPYQALLY